MTKRLQDKVCVVTGSSRGIGAAIAKAYAAEGGTVVVTYCASPEPAQEVARECGSELVLPLDVRSRESVSNARSPAATRLSHPSSKSAVPAPRRTA